MAHPSSLPQFLDLPYVENITHGPNFTQPPPKIVQGEDEHYEVEKVLQSKISPNHKGILYLIKWKGYPDSENSWLPSSEMTHSQDLVQKFHKDQPRTPRPKTFSADGAAWR